MYDAKLWEERRLRELNVSMYVYGLIAKARRSLLRHCLSSLPDSYYDNDQNFRALKSKFVGDIDIADIAAAIVLYLKKVRGMEQRLQHLLARHVP
jgi:hypothetical protein